MINALEAATRAIDTHLNGRARARIGRADVDKHGRLVLQVGDDRWFRYDGELVELDPHRDRRVPLARMARAAGTIVSYRPERRIVVRCDSPQGSGCTYAKGLRAGRGAQAAERHRAGARAARSAGFEAPELIDVDAGSSVLRLSELAGMPLRITDPGTFERLGQRLREFQEQDSTSELDVFDPPEVRRELERWASKVRTATGTLPTGWEAAHALWLDSVAPERSPRVLAHRDLHDGQFVQTSAGLGLLDFDGLARADPALDLANLDAHLYLRGLQRWLGATSESALRASSALLAGHGCQAEADFTQRLHFYRTATFLRLALLYALRPRWSELVPDLVRLASPALRRTS